MADLNAKAAKRTFLHEGFMVVTDPTTKHVEEPGRADLKVLGRGRGVCVEVKFGWNSFTFADWRENQREWAMTYCEAPPFNIEYWIYLTIGLKHRTNQKSLSEVKFSPSWLMPMSKMLEVESLIEPVQGSIPYQAGKGYRVEMQQKCWDADNLFAEYALDWNAKNSILRPHWYDGVDENYPWCMWTIPTHHEFYQKYVLPQEAKKAS